MNDRGESDLDPMLCALHITQLESRVKKLEKENAYLQRKLYHYQKTLSSCDLYVRLDIDKKLN